MDHLVLLSVCICSASEVQLGIFSRGHYDQRHWVHCVPVNLRFSQIYDLTGFKLSTVIMVESQRDSHPMM